METGIFRISVHDAESLRDTHNVRYAEYIPESLARVAACGRGRGSRVLNLVRSRAATRHTLSLARVVCIL
jgi:hypothetical protein